MNLSGESQIMYKAEDAIRMGTLMPDKRVGEGH